MGLFLTALCFAIVVTAIFIIRMEGSFVHRDFVVVVVVAVNSAYYLCCIYNAKISSSKKRKKGHQTSRNFYRAQKQKNQEESEVPSMCDGKMMQNAVSFFKFIGCSIENINTLRMNLFNALGMTVTDLSTLYLNHKLSQILILSYGNHTPSISCMYIIFNDTILTILFPQLGCFFFFFLKKKISLKLQYA